MITNFIMQDLEEDTIKMATHKPLCWFRYVDDTFVKNGPMDGKS
jgi:hypothetical protein